MPDGFVSGPRRPGTPNPHRTPGCDPRGGCSAGEGENKNRKRAYQSDTGLLLLTTLKSAEVGVGGAREAIGATPSGHGANKAKKKKKKW